MDWISRCWVSIKSRVLQRPSVPSHQSCNNDKEKYAYLSCYDRSTKSTLRFQLRIVSTHLQFVSCRFEMHLMPDCRFLTLILNKN